MNRYLFSFFLLLFFLFTKTALAQSTGGSVVPETIEAKKLDRKAEILAAYLQKHDSPLQYHAQDFIDAANKYNLDWRLVAAISGVESTFGKQIPGGFNGWGWGVYGNQAIYFNSWTEGIFTISQDLRENYLNKGLTDPISINRIYAESPTWGYKVNYFMADLEKFSLQYGADNKKISDNPKIAAVSGQLVLR